MAMNALFLGNSLISSNTAIIGPPWILFNGSPILFNGQTILFTSA